MRHEAASSKGPIGRRDFMSHVTGGGLYEPPGGNLVDCLPPALSTPAGTFSLTYLCDGMFVFFPTFYSNYEFVLGCSFLMSISL